MPEKYKTLWTLWRKALIIKVLGRNITFRVLEQRVRDLWNLEHRCKMIDLEQGYAVVRFYSREYYLHVLGEGPWIMMGHYLTMARWHPNLRPLLNVITSTLAWIRLPDIPVELFHEELLLWISNKIGKAVKIDYTTLSVTRGRFVRGPARTCEDLTTVKEAVDGSYGPWMIPRNFCRNRNSNSSRIYNAKQLVENNAQGDKDKVENSAQGQKNLELQNYNRWVAARLKA
ncbi:hypothetical protein M9H77_25191 [Catharanthus roseus]|uniref:Uncharacterized protein n=1 Tax=Catharanthus roseus TaxID=4058 RepID=A0ACC0A682_CATRO|nr:hypothetical protein M9H77_25191 [Catharanthus roseus]